MNSEQIKDEIISKLKEIIEIQKATIRLKNEVISGLLKLNESLIHDL